jgi:hypothetical protein
MGLAFPEPEEGSEHICDKLEPDGLSDHQQNRDDGVKISTIEKKGFQPISKKTEDEKKIDRNQGGVNQQLYRKSDKRSFWRR